MTETPMIRCLTQVSGPGGDAADQNDSHPRLRQFVNATTSHTLHYS